MVKNPCRRTRTHMVVGRSNTIHRLGKPRRNPLHPRTHHHHRIPLGTHPHPHHPHSHSKHHQPRPHTHHPHRMHTHHPTPHMNPLHNIKKTPNKTQQPDTHTTNHTTPTPPNPNTNWRTQANCKGKTNQMFPKDHKDITYIRPARQLCKNCPVQPQCLEDALQYPTTDMSGVWAGYTPRQLAAEQRRRGIVPSRPSLAVVWKELFRGG